MRGSFGRSRPFVLVLRGFDASIRGLGLRFLGVLGFLWNLGFWEGGVLGGRGFGVLGSFSGPDLRKSESLKPGLVKEEEERPIEDAKEATSDLMRSMSLGISDFRVFEWDFGAFEIAIFRDRESSEDLVGF